MSTSNSPTLYQYPIWELPAFKVVQTRSLLSLSGYKEILEEKQLIVPHLVGLPRPEAYYLLLDETFFPAIIQAHHRLNEQAAVQIVDDDDDSQELHRMEMELDKESCARRNTELTTDPAGPFAPLDQLKHGDIIQFRNERLQFSFYVYRAKKGTFGQLVQQFQRYVAHLLEQRESAISNVQSIATDEYELMLIPSIQPDGYGIPSLFNDVPLRHFSHLSPGVMYRWIYVNLIDPSMPIYALVQQDIQRKKHSPNYRSLVNEAGVTDDLINEDEDGEEMNIEDLDTFPCDYVCLYDEVKTKLNVEWMKIDSNDYCNQFSAMYLLTKWTQQLQ